MVGIAVVGSAVSAGECVEAEALSGGELVLLDQPLDLPGVPFRMTVAEDLADTAGRLNPDVGEKDTGLDPDRGDLLDGDRRLVLREP